MLWLPIDDVLPELIEALRATRSAVIVAPPGAGKTTRVPPAILASGLLPDAHPNLVMLQPRRVAARVTAMRIAQEQHWTLGQEVGYHVRFDRQITSQTRLRILTEGILTRQLLDDPLLDGVGGVILDEFHERSLNSDLALALLREVREARPELLLIVMSATLDAEPVARYLGDCPIIRSQGRLHPVQVSYAPDLSANPLEVHAAKHADQLARDDAGDVLVFLPGAREIHATIDALRRLNTPAELCPLYGAMDLADQVRAITPYPTGHRRIICATNIAETSLTIQGVTAVVDSGLERVAFYDTACGLDRLDLCWISQASATQRAGRAGRLRPGRCLRLYSEKSFHAMSPFSLAEVQRVDLSQAILSLHAWGHADVRAFAWLERPDEQMIQTAERLLVMLGALTTGPDARITPLGRRILELPAHPRIGRLLIGASDAGCPDQGATLAALLSEKDLYAPSSRSSNDPVPHLRQSNSDLLLRMDDFQRAQHRSSRHAATDQQLDDGALRQVAAVREQLRRIIPTSRSKHAHRIPDDDLLRRLILLAYPDRVCHRRPNDPMSAVMVGAGGVRLSPQSTVRQAPLFVAIDAYRDQRTDRPEPIVKIASAIEESWLGELFPDSIHTVDQASFDPSSQAVVAMRQVMYRDLVLHDKRTGRPSPQQAYDVLRHTVPLLAEQIEQECLWLTILSKRIEFLRATLPAHLSGDEKWLTPDLHQLLQDACAGAWSIADVKTNLPAVVNAHLGHEARRLLDRYAPEKITVPTGNDIRLDWSAARTSPDIQGPTLAVRLQELFGLAQTPRIAGDRVPVVLHLLGPNFRPVQITNDLASFWRNTYPQVRKDLRARYPKHAWPDDPLTAPPQSKGRPKKQ